MSEYESNESVETLTGSTEYSVYDTVENNGKAFGIVSLVCGILSFPLSCCSIVGSYVGLIIAVTSFVFGVLSITKKESAKNMAIAGIICSSIAIVIMIILLIVYYNPDFLSRLGSSIGF